jgi:hypothetical protein
VDEVLAEPRALALPAGAAFKPACGCSFLADKVATAPLAEDVFDDGIVVEVIGSEVFFKKL